MNEVVTADGKTVTVATDLPDAEVWVSHFRTSSNSCSTTVDGLHGIGVYVIGQTAGATDTRYDCHVVGCNTHFCHGFMERRQEEMVAATRTPTWLSLLIVLECIFTHNALLL